MVARHYLASATPVLCPCGTAKHRKPSASFIDVGRKVRHAHHAWVFGDAAAAERRPEKRLKNEGMTLPNICHHEKSCLTAASIASSAQSTWSLVITSGGAMRMV